MTGHHQKAPVSSIEPRVGSSPPPEDVPATLFLAILCLCPPTLTPQSHYHHPPSRPSPHQGHHQGLLPECLEAWVKLRQKYIKKKKIFMYFCLSNTEACEWRVTMWPDGGSSDDWGDYGGPGPQQGAFGPPPPSGSTALSVRQASPSQPRCGHWAGGHFYRHSVSWAHDSTWFWPHLLDSGPNCSILAPIARFWPQLPLCLPHGGPSPKLSLTSQGPVPGTCGQHSPVPSRPPTAPRPYFMHTLFKSKTKIHNKKITSSTKINLTYVDK